MELRIEETPGLRQGYILIETWTGLEVLVTDLTQVMSRTVYPSHLTHKQFTYVYSY